MLTAIVPVLCFMSIHTLFRNYCHYHHYNILYQNIITAKIYMAQACHTVYTLDNTAANVRGGPFSDLHQFIHFTYSLKYKPFSPGPAIETRIHLGGHRL